MTLGYPLGTTTVAVQPAAHSQPIHQRFFVPNGVVQ